MDSGKAAAIPLVRNEATLSFCQAWRSVRITTAILVSNCMHVSTTRHSGARVSANPNAQLRIVESRNSCARFRVRCCASPRYDGEVISPVGVAGPGADHAFL